MATSGRPVRHPGDRHLPEHRPQHAPMFSFDPTAGHLILTDNRPEALLTDRAYREMIIKQPAQKLPPVAVQTLLKPGVIKTSGVSPVQEANQRLELLTTRSEPIHYRRLANRAAGVADPFDCTITTTAPERQDFTHRRVKFNSTGVEIGGHVRPPPWSTKDLNTADFDTLPMTPRPRPAPQRPRPPTTPPPNDPASQPRRTPKPPAISSPQAKNRPPSTTPPPRRRRPAPRPTSETSRIYRGFTVSPDRPRVTSEEPHPPFYADCARMPTWARNVPQSAMSAAVKVCMIARLADPGDARPRHAATRCC